MVSAEDLAINWHLAYLCDELQALNDLVTLREPKAYDLVINIPPGTTKSTIVSQLYQAWVWTIDPAQRFISSSFNKSLAISHAIKTRDVIQSAKYKKLFPGIKLKEDQSGKTDFLNTLGGQRYVTSTTSAVTGVHAHQIIVDDPIDPRQSASATEREAADNHLKTLSTRKVDKRATVTILIMQRVHEEDPTALMLQNSNVKHICLPAELSDQIKPANLADMYRYGLLDPGRLNREALAEAKSKLGSYGYAGQFGQTPAPPEGGIFKKEFFSIVDWSAKIAALDWHFVADTAYTEKEKNDPSGWLAYARDGADYYIRNAETIRVEFPALCKALPAFAMLNGYTRKSIIEVEPKASGKSLVQVLKAETGLNVKEGKTPTKDKEARARLVSPICEAGRVKLIRGPWNAAFIDEVCTFPRAAHDELVDCLTMILNGKSAKARGVKRRN